MSDWTTARVVRDRDGDMWGREREGWNLISAENTEAWYPSDTCAGPQCRRKVDARGLCKAHYMQAWKGRQLTILIDKHALPPHPRRAPSEWGWYIGRRFHPGDWLRW